MISPALRTFLCVLTAAYAVIGGLLLAAPAWAAGLFAWQVSPLIAATIGGWCLGTAWLSLIVARRGTWPAVLAPIVYLALFGILETGVLIAFRQRISLGNPLAAGYVATIAATGLFAIAALVEGWRRQPVLAAVGQRMGAVTAGFVIVFILFVGFLGVYGLLAVEGMPALDAGIFPETMTPLSLRAFGAFYLALSLSAVPLLWARGRGNILTHGYAAYGLIVFITAAALVFIEQFDFAARPTQAIYIGVYLLVGTVVGIYLVRYGTGAGKA